ncbi:MAG: DUF349 domain-containing protein [Arenicella sp.]
MIKVLNKLFKPSWTHKSAEVRLQAIEALNAQDQQDQSILVKLASNDSDGKVRSTAVSKIRDIVSLWKLADEHSQTSEQRLFTEQLANVLKDSDTTLTEISAVYDHAAPSLQTLIVAYCHNEDFRHQKINMVTGNTEQLLQILEHTHFAGTRLKICESIDDLSSLEKARTLIKGKDKAAERVLKEKISSLKAHQNQLLTQQQERSAILADMQYLNDRAKEFLALAVKPISGEQSFWRQDHSQKWLSLQHRWQAVDNSIADKTLSDDELQYAEFSSTIVNADDKLQSIYKAKAHFPGAQKTLQAFIQKVDTLDSLGNNAPARTELAEIESLWQDNARHLSPEPDPLLRFNANLEQASALLNFSDDLQQALATADLELNQQNEQMNEEELEELTNWFEQQLKLAPAKSTIRKELLQITDQYQQQANNKREQFKKTIDGLHKQVNSLVQSLNSKDLPAALGKYRRLDTAAMRFLRTLHDIDLNANNVAPASSSDIETVDEQAEPDLSLPKQSVPDLLEQSFSQIEQEAKLQQYQLDQLSGLHKRIHDAHHDLNELNDWKSFATEPQCVELCTAMDKLAQNRNSVKPQQQADNISQLLSQWKALGSSNATDNHWPTFKASMDLANEPCATYFAELKQTKQANLQQLKVLADAMREVATAVDNAKEVDCGIFLKQVTDLDTQWKKFQNVDRSKGQKQWQRFKAARDQVYALLEPHFSDNLARKEILLKRAESMLQQITEKGVTDTSFDALKQLQSAWKQIGMARQRDDSKLWRAFKSQSDAIYNKIKENRDELKAADQALISERTDIIQAIISIASSANSIGELDRDVSQQQELYIELSPLPETVPERSQKQVESQYRNAINTVDARRELLTRERSASEMQHFIAKAEIVNTLTNTSEEEQKKELIEQWNALELTDPSLKTAAKKRFDIAIAGKKVDLKKLEHDKRLLCIQAELLSNSATPEHDKALRTEYQLQQMQQSGLGKQVLNLGSQVELTVAWYSLPELATEIELPLKKRFDNSVKKLT